MTLIPKTPITNVSLIDAKYDFASSTRPTTFYAVATYARTGSYMLCEKLWRSGQMGAPYEYFNHFNLMIQMTRRLGVDSIQDYVNRLFELRTSSNGTFGIKLFPEHFQFMHLARIVWMFPGLKFIYLDRVDVLAQAISYAKAMQTSQWTTLDVSQAKPEYDYDLILNCIGRIEQAKNFWEAYFSNNKIQPIRISYEKLVADTESSIQSILQKFNVIQDDSFSLDLPVIEKQRDRTNTEWKQQLQKELASKNPGVLKKYQLLKK